jgi:iron complex outermembrane recepter protein
MNPTSRYFKHLLMAGTAGMALTTVAATQAAAQTSNDDTVIVVTAQKREQRLQDVPIVVTSLSSRVLQNAGVKDIKDMQILTPGMTVTSTSSEALTTVRIRGVGTVGDNPGLESSVGIVIDGVYRPRNGVGFGDLGEMDRVEVLKGPQGTLFGKNTSAGVINVLTKAPSFKYGFNGEATVGNFGAKGGSVSVTGPLIADKLAGRLFVAHRVRDGFTTVKAGAGPRSEAEDGDLNYYTVRGQLLFVPTDNLSARIIADYSKRDENCCVGVLVKAGPTAGFINALSGGTGLSTTVEPEARTAYSNRGTEQNITDKGLSAEVNYDLSGGTKLTSVSALRGWKTVNAQDLDFTAADIWYRKPNGDYGTKFMTFSQELRLAGATEKLNWLVGAFYADETLKNTNSWFYGSAYESYISLLLTASTTPSTTFVSGLTGLPVGQSFVANSQAGVDHYKQTSKSFAIFTNNSYQLTDKLELTLGLRYTSEEKKLEALQTNLDGAKACALSLQRSATEAGTWAFIPEASEPTILGTVCLNWATTIYNNRQYVQSSDEGKVTGTLKAAYRFNAGVMGYASYARGYKGAGYNIDRAPVNFVTLETGTYFPGESVDSYEIGLKTSIMSGRLQINLAAFDQSFSDFQLNAFAGASFAVESIPQLDSKGIDADFYWVTPISGLSLQGGLTLADTKYANFTAADMQSAARFPGASLLPGNQMSFAPKTSISLSGNWAGEVGGLKVGANLSAKYNSEYNTGSDLLPTKLQQAFTLLNGRLSVGSTSQRWVLELWGQNLTDETYKQVVFNGPLQGTFFQSTVQTAGSHPGTYYDAAKDTGTYYAFLGAPRTYGLTLRVKY